MTEPYLRSGCVLVVEPEAAARREIADLLLMSSFLVLCSIGAREALDLLRDGLSPDVLVFDVRLTTRELTRFDLSFSPPPVPVVAVLARNRVWPGSPETAERVVRSTLQELPATVREVISRRER